MYLLDTNIFLEYILKRDHLEEVRGFFHRADLSRLYVSDFSLHTLGVIFLKAHKPQDFLQFVNEDVLASGIRILPLLPEDYQLLTDVSTRYRLDFDDAYQYAVAEKHALSVVSFDRDFDRTDKGRKLPGDLFRE